MVGTRAIMDWIRDEYGKTYAPNTRETVRRVTLHQFVAALLAEENPDEPTRPTNSPKWCYQVNARALEVIRLYGQPDHEEVLRDYLVERPGLKAQYDAAREIVTTPGPVLCAPPRHRDDQAANVMIRTARDVRVSSSWRMAPTSSF